MHRSAVVVGPGARAVSEFEHCQTVGLQVLENTFQLRDIGFNVILDGSPVRCKGGLVYKEILPPAVVLSSQGKTGVHTTDVTMGHKKTSQRGDSSNTYFWSIPCHIGLQFCQTVVECLGV